MKPLAFALQAHLAVLPLYYALAQEGMPCTVTIEAEGKSLHCTPLNVSHGACQHPTLRGLYLTPTDQLLRIEAFVRGWLAYHYQEPLDPDKRLTVSRVPKPFPFNPIQPVHPSFGCQGQIRIL